MKQALLTLLILVGSMVCRAAEFDRSAAQYIEQHCADCHDAAEKKGGLDITALKPDFGNADNFAWWVKVFDRVESGEMPPKKKARPAAGESAAFLGALGKELVTAEERASKAGGGRTTVRRMNRAEYENALRDLLALPLLRVKELLPEDGQQFGFDKVAGALDISHVQMTKYLQAADVALRQAVVKAARPETKTWREPAAKQDTMRAAIATHNAVPLAGRALAPGLTTHVVGNPESDYGNTYRGASFSGEADTAAVLTGVIGVHQPEGIQMDHFRPTVSGWYRVRFSIWSLRWERTKAVPAVRGLIRNYLIFGTPFFKNTAGQWEFTRMPQEKAEEGRMENVEFYGTSETTHIVRASLKGEPLGYFDAPSFQPKTHEFKVWLNPGERISFHAMTLPSSAAHNSGMNDGVVGYEGPAVAYDWFEAEGPLAEQWPPESQRRLFGTVPLGAYPRSPLAGAPVVEAGATTKLPLAGFKGPGQMLGDERYLNVNGTVALTVNCAVPGEHEFSVTAFESHAGNEAAKMVFMVGEQEMSHGRFSVEALRGAAKTYRAKFRVESVGPVTVGVQFVNDFLDETKPEPLKHDRNLYFTNIEVTAPKPPPGEAVAAKTTDHRSLLLSFATRAFRRPVAAEEVAPYAAIAEEQLARGVNFENAMLAGYKGILCSAEFLFMGLESGVPKANAARLGDHALASRLAFCLWNSAPDETLLAIAEKQTLSQRDTLRAQVERMLADARSERFIEHFLDEWLELKKMDFTTPDPNLYPEFDPWLRDSMLAESRAYFRRMLTQNLGVRHVVAADTLLINQRLAEQYGIRGVAGAELREVPVGDTKRGGFLTQAAVLKVTANGTATSPVLRGVWVMERLLGIPRDPPPPNIPAIEPDATGAVTIREMIEKHRADAACASCHAKMDPPGMALESFDVIGGYRDRYRLAGTPGKDEPFVEIIISTAGHHRARTKMRLGPAVDASGELASGGTFTDVNGLRALLLQNEDALARNLIRQLLIYATGTGLRFTDRNAIEAIVAKTGPTKHGLRSIVQEVVASELFQTK